MQCLEGNIHFTRCGTIGTPEKDEQAWECIHDAYLKRFGMTKHYKALMELLKKKADIQLEYILNKDKFSLTLLEIEEENLKIMLSNNGTGMTIEQTLVHLSKFVGYWLRTKEITTGEYFTLLEEFKRTNDIENGKKN